MESKVNGRICICGEHSDWASEFGYPGLCVVANVEQHVTLLGSPSHECSITEGTKTYVVSANSQSLSRIAKENGYMGFFCGTMAHLVEYGKGLAVVVEENTIPKKIGMSSSAAFCCALAELYHKVYHIPYTPERIMDIAYKGEREGLSMCGKMDQFCYLSGLKTLFLKNGDIREVPLSPGAPMTFLVIDFKKEKNTSKILSDLREEVERGEGQEYFTYFNPIYFENICRSIRLGRLDKVGEWMKEAQNGFEKCIGFLSKELKNDLFLEFTQNEIIKDNCYGWKEMGSHGDGCALLLVKNVEPIIDYAESLGYSAYKTEVT